MTRTIRFEILDTLEDLSDADFKKFCENLLLRSEEPRLTRDDVAGKPRMAITDLLVSTFTEPDARQETLGLLRKINCNDKAERLESRTRICVDRGDPTFPKTSNGELDTKPSQEALAYVKSSQPVKGPNEVEAEAKALVLCEGGDPSIDRLVLSRFTIQFGKYKAKCFKWLLENDVDYVAYLVAKHQKEAKSIAHQKPHMANTVRREITIQYANGLKGTKLVGFGKHRSMRLQDLYEDQENVGYVNYLRSKASTCELGSKMQDAVGYILKRDKMKASASTANRPTTSGTPQAASRRPIKRKRAQSTKARPSTAKRPKGRKEDSGWKRRSRPPRC